MAEFPPKVSTHTSTPEASGGGGSSIRPDIGYLRSIPGIFTILEIVLGLLVWALIADCYCRVLPAYGWVLFDSIFCWVLTIILFILVFLQIPRRFTKVPWPSVVFIFFVAATVLYFIGFITCAASAPLLGYGYNYDRAVAASFFAFLVTIAYGVNAVYSFIAWRASRSNAASA